MQATFKAYSPGSVPLSPKDCRASFVTWLRDGAHGDECVLTAGGRFHVDHHKLQMDSAADTSSQVDFCLQ